jgi:nucleoside-diphosphate-sugar epimerase
MKVLVTGATGGLGALIVENLIRRGIEVIATSRDVEKAKKSDFYPNVTYIPYEIKNDETKNLFEYFQKPDRMIHCAWEKLGAAEYKNKIHTTEILEKHKVFVNNLIQNGLKDITVVGSCYEYGLREGILKEEFESAPTVEYSIAKNLLREYIDSKVKEFNLIHKWVRVFYVFGPVKGRKNLYTQLVEAIERGDKSFNMSGGEQTRDFLTSEEIAEYIVRISLQDKVTGIINCCSGKPVVLKEFIKQFLADNNYKIELNFGFYPYPDYEPMHTWGSIEKLKQVK